MIRVISSANIATNAHYVAGFAALRHRVFVKRLGWDVTSATQSKGYEYDRYDTNETVYLVICNTDDEVVAGLRLLKTTRPFVLAECFPYLVEDSIPVSDKVWEVSRFVVDPEAARRAGAHTLNSKLIWALHSYGLISGLSNFVSVSYAGMERLMQAFGCRFRRLGSPRSVDGRRVVALSIEISEEIVAGMERRLFMPALQPSETRPDAAVIAGMRQPMARPVTLA